MTYKAVLVEDLPNLAWVFGYTNAPWTLKSDLAGEYLSACSSTWTTTGTRSPRPVDTEDSALDDGHLDSLQSGYVQRAKDDLPRQGTRAPWKVLMHYGQDTKMLLEDPIDDGLLQFEPCARAPRSEASRA